MALKLNFESLIHGINYPEAYARIINAVVSSGFIRMVVGVYAAEASRVKEKVLVDLHQSLSDADENIQKRANEHNIAVEASHIKLNEFNDVAAKFLKGEVKEDARDKAKETFEKAKEAENKALKAVDTARAIAEQLRAGLNASPAIQPVEVKDYTFAVTPEMLAENPFYTLCYNLLKDVPEFKDAENI